MTATAQQIIHDAAKTHQIVSFLPTAYKGTPGKGPSGFAWLCSCGYSGTSSLETKAHADAIGHCDFMNEKEYSRANFAAVYAAMETAQQAYMQNRSAENRDRLEKATDELARVCRPVLIPGEYPVFTIQCGIFQNHNMRWMDIKTYSTRDEANQALIKETEKRPDIPHRIKEETTCQQCKTRQTDPNGIGHASKLCEKCATARLNPYGA